MSSLKIDTAAQPGSEAPQGQSGRKRFVIAMREPWSLPEDQIELPSPGSLPGNPPQLNLISSILPPLVMLGGVVLLAQLSPEMGESPAMYLMPVMSLAFPIGNVISYYSQKRDYKKKMAEREVKYRALLSQISERADALIVHQRTVLEKEYPNFTKTKQIALGKGSRRRLWWRRAADPDFLALRMGTGDGKPSISVSVPKTNDPNETLGPLAAEVAARFQIAPELPALINLPRVGSLAISSKSETGAQIFARRLVADVLVHHSPQDVQIVVLADSEEAQKRWEWLKWAPHTRAILQGENIRRIAFEPAAVDKCLEWLRLEYDQRIGKGYEPGRKSDQREAIVVILDDSGDIRQSADVKLLAESGHEARIYMIFPGGRYWPRECRAKVEINDPEFSYVETWAAEKGSNRIRGRIDSAGVGECEQMARSLAGLELTRAKGTSNLPESVRLYDLLDIRPVTVEAIKQNWLRGRQDEELLHFNFGFRGGRKGLEEAGLNLLPEDLDGSGAYHTILVGTTGSGKSEFMKSLVLSAATTYSPADLNFFFMDFKGGAAFNVLKDLPHVVGVVTNLNPQLVERGLSAMEAEIDRRQKCFAEQGVQNIWAYNARNRSHPIPHLLLVLDEFARGYEEFGRLPDMLDRLVRQGRSLGMYMLLANQDVNSAVDKLLNNVGWRIALKVAKQEDMHIIERSLAIPKRPGQGYLISTTGDPMEFQAAYSGFPMRDPAEKSLEEFRIYQVNRDGRWQLLHTSGRKEQIYEARRQTQSEQDHLIAMMSAAAESIQPAPPIYLDPLEQDIPLQRAFEESAIRPVFDGEWNPDRSQHGRLLAPVGFMDSPQECLQREMSIDFDDQDGHLWVVGSPSSGKSMTLESILLSLALTHTPEEAWFYILEFGAGRLLKFEELPHTGAVIRKTDPVERLNKLLNFLDAEMDRRSGRMSSSSEGEAQPAIFLVINNFAEMRSTFPDQSEKIARYARDGKAVGLHLIITTNRRIELARLVIARRIVLRMANHDDFVDAIGKSSLQPAVQAEGRGVWVDRTPLECQIAQPQVCLTGQSELEEARSIIQAMHETWKGGTPRQIRVLQTRILLDELLSQLPAPRKDAVRVPVGIAFENLELVAPQLLKELPRWLVLGPPRSGKSNFLACLATSLLKQDKQAWDISYFALRRSPLDWADGSPLQIYRTTDAILQACNELIAGLDDPAAKHQLVLIDDLGAAFESGKEPLAAALNNLHQKSAANTQFYVVAAALTEEIRSQQMLSPLVKGLKQNRTGVCLSKDSNDTEMLGMQVPLEYRRMELPTGRGVWISGNKIVLLQTPLLGEEHEDEA